MAFDQQINYRINIDDANFQSKLSQLRASLDSTVGGGGGMGMAAMGAMFSPSGGSMYGGPMFMGGMADFGSQVRPVTYTPPAIAMQPHFGMVAMRQTTAQAMSGTGGFLGSVAYSNRELLAGGLGGAAIGAMFGGPLGAVGGGLFGAAIGAARTDFTRDLIPQEMTAAQYFQQSARTFGTRLGDSVATGALASGTAALSIGASAVGAVAGRALAGGVGAFLGGAFVGPVIPAAYGSAVSDMMADNRSIQSTLEAGSFRFLTGGNDVDPLTGRGFSNRARGQIASDIQAMELKDVRYGMNEYKQILESGMQMDMFSGTSGVDDFKSKFKGLVDNLKTITAVLHTSLKDGMDVIRGFRDMGVTNSGDVSRMVYQSETLGRMSGKTGMEMLAVGQQGAELFRGTGVRMGLGFESAQTSAYMISQGLRSGTLSREAVAQAGGEAGLAQQMTASALGFTQTAFGRGIMMASTRFGQAAPDPSKVAGGDVFSLMGGVAGMTPGQIMHFQANQEEIIGNMSPMQLQMMPIAGAMAQARTLAGAGMGIKFKDAFVALQLQNGTPRHIIDAQLSMMKQNPDELKQQMEQQLSQTASEQALESTRNTYGFKAITNKLKENFVKPASDYLMGISNDIKQAVEDFGVELTGGVTARTPSVTRQSVERGKKIIEESYGGNASEATRGTQFGVVDATGSLGEKFFGRGQSGESLASRFIESGTAGSMTTSHGTVDTITYGGMTAMRFKTVEDVQRYNSQSGQQMYILTKDAKKGSPVLAIPGSQLTEKQKQLIATQPSASDRERAEREGLSEEQRAAISNLRYSEMVSGKKADVSAYENALFGRDIDLSNVAQASRERAVLEHAIGGSESARESYDQKYGDAVSRALQGGVAKSYKDLEKLMDDGARGLSQTLTNRGLLLSGSSVAGDRRLMAARALESMSGGARAAALELASREEGTAEFAKAFERLTSYTGDEKYTQQFVQGLSAVSKEERKKIQESVGSVVDQHDIAAYSLETDKRSATNMGGIKGLDQVGMNGQLGTLTKEAFTDMTRMAKQLEDSMQNLLNLQKQFKEAMGPNKF